MLRFQRFYQNELLLICSVKLWENILYNSARFLHTCCRNFQVVFMPGNVLVGKNFLTERVVKYWNRVPREIKSLEVFNKQGDVALCDIVWGGCGVHDLGDLLQP